MNRHIAEHSHFELMWPLVQKDWRAIWIDEFHHGYRTGRGLTAVYPAWLLASLLPVAAAALLWLWAQGKRFGPVYTPREWTVRRGDETLRAVAAWYERRKLYADAMRHQIRYLRQLLRERWGVPEDADEAELIRMAEAHGSGEQAERLRRVFDRLREAESGTGSRPYSAKQLAEDTRRIERFIRELEKE